MTPQGSVLLFDVRMSAPSTKSSGACRLGSSHVAVRVVLVEISATAPSTQYLRSSFFSSSSKYTTSSGVMIADLFSTLLWPQIQGGTEGKSPASQLCYRQTTTSRLRAVAETKWRPHVLIWNRSELAIQQHLQQRP